MKWNEPPTLKVQILSPVAIGTEEKCKTLGFVADGSKRVMVIDERQFVAALNDSQCDLFLDWLKLNAEKLAYLREQTQRAIGNRELQKRLQEKRRAQGSTNFAG